MRAPKVYAVSILMTIGVLLATGYSQAGNAPRVPEATSSQNSRTQPANSGEGAAPGAVHNTANNPGQGAPTTLQKGPSPGTPATPANAAAGDITSALATAPPESQAGVPQSALLEFLFHHISDLNEMADKDDKAGKHISATAWRTHDQRAVGLNDSEGQILQEVALDCARMLSVQDVKIRASAEKFRAQLKPGAPVQIPPELVQMVEDRNKIVSDHVERLREALGDASFNKLATYVHSSFHAEVIVPKPTNAPLSTTEKSPKDNK